MLLACVLVVAACGDDGGAQGIGEITPGGGGSQDGGDGSGSDGGSDADGDGGQTGDGDGDGDGSEPGSGEGQGSSGPPGPGELRTALTDTRATEIPDSFWAIEEETFDLVQVSSSTGEVVRRVGGWGAEAAAGELPQVLSTVEVDTTGQLWIDDCCEPAFGTFYRVGPDTQLDLTNPSADVVARTGLSPQVSHDGALVAAAVGDASVSVLETATAQEAAGSSGILALLAEDLNLTTQPFARPMAWVRNDVVVVGVSTDSQDILRAVWVGEGGPTLVGPTISVPEFIVDVDVQTNGNLVLALVERDGSPADGPVAGQVIDPDTGDVAAAFDLPPGTISIDYDESGTFLITVDVDGQVTWLGRGQSGVIGDTYLDAAW